MLGGWESAKTYVVHFLGSQHSKRRLLEQIIETLLRVQLGKLKGHLPKLR